VRWGRKECRYAPQEVNETKVNGGGSKGKMLSTIKWNQENVWDEEPILKKM
jgi:hypothetical protein